MHMQCLPLFTLLLALGNPRQAILHQGLNNVEKFLISLTLIRMTKDLAVFKGLLL
jgi:hypothetical protein